MKWTQSLWRMGVLILVTAGLLVACSSVPVRGAYTAAGDGPQPDELSKTSTFKPDDDLNVVITLNAHNRELAVSAIFKAPDGQQYSTDTLEADETVGKVVLGLDWESQGTNYWPAGEWTIEIYVDEFREKEVTFSVSEAPPVVPGPTPTG